MPFVRGGRAAKRCGQRNPARGPSAHLNNDQDRDNAHDNDMTASIGAGADRDDGSEEERLVHLRLLARHSVRMVRFLSLCARWLPSSPRCSFAGGNDTAALHVRPSLTFAAGFHGCVTFGPALIFGRVGDLVGRKYTFLVTIMALMGTSVPSWSACCRLSPPGRLAAPILLIEPAAAARPRSGRRIWRRRRSLCRASTRGPRSTRLRPPAGSEDHRDARSLLAGAADRAGFGSACAFLPIAADFSGCTTAGGFAFLVSVDPAGRGLNDLYPAQAGRARRRSSREMKEEGKGSTRAADPESFFRAMVEQQIRAARALRRNRRSRGGVVHGPVLRTVLPHHHAEAELPAVSAHMLIDGSG